MKNYVIRVPVQVREHDEEAWHEDAITFAVRAPDSTKAVELLTKAITQSARESFNPFAFGWGEPFGGSGVG